jgi:hypothetical protein
VPDYFAERGGGPPVVVDCRPADRRGPRDLAAFEATRRACGLAGWEYRLVGALDPVATAIGQRLGRPGYQPADTSDPIAHWMKYDSWQSPSRPHTTFPQTRRYGHGPARPVTTSRQSLQRHERSSLWFQLYRRGGRVILHHGHIRPVLIRDWSRPMDGIAATIWASQTTLPLEPDGRLKLATS